MTKKCVKVIFYLIFSVCFTQNSSIAATGAAFLNIGTSARAIGMGGAYTAVAKDVTAINYNPAGLSQLKSREIIGQHTEWIGDMRHDFVAVAMPTSKGTVGASIVYLSQSRIEGRDEDRRKTSSFTAYDAAATISYSMSLNRDLKFGSNVKIIEQKIADETAMGMGMDLGILYNTESVFGMLPQGMSLGMTVQNLGPQMRFISEGYNLPLTACMGIGYKVCDFAGLAMDIKRKIYEKKTEISFGTEYNPVIPMSLRVGYMKYIGGESGISVSELKGLGGGVGFKVLNFSTDYAFTPYGDLGNAHRISFSSKF